MFSRSSKNGGEHRAEAPSIIAADCRITGDIACDGEIHVDGQVEGDLQGDVVVVGEKGAIRGAIRAKTVRVLGTITGQIRAQAVELAKTARVLGDIHHESLAVAAGAYVEGHCNRLNAPPADGAAIALPDRNGAGQPLLTAGESSRTPAPAET